MRQRFTINYKDRRILYIIFFFCIFSTILTFSKLDQQIIINNESKRYNAINTLNYIDIDPFIIDESGNGDYTWEEISNEIWCQGNGTYSNPYIISNLEINCYIAYSHGACIEVLNSNKFFIIEECKLYSSDEGYYKFKYGIRMENTNNSLIRDNKFVHDNELHLHSGIRLYNSHNNTMINNYIKWVGSGIHLEGSKFNTITNNIIVKSGDQFSCIYTDSNSIDNTISNNYCGLEDPVPQKCTFITDHQKIHKNNILIQWNLIENADNYSIFIDGVFYVNSKDNQEIIFFNNNGSYSITVISINKYGESEPSDPLYILVELIPKLEPPIIFTKNQTIYTNNIVIEWSEVQRADNYSIYINGSFYDKSKDNQELINFQNLGIYTITITAVNSYWESEHSLPLYIEVISPDGDSIQISGYNFIIILIIIFGIVIILKRSKKIVKFF